MSVNAPSDTATSPVPRQSGPAIPYSGNAPLFDQEKYIRGAVLTDVQDKIFHEGTPQEWSAYLWFWESEGTLRPWPWSELTGKTASPPNKKGEINRLTELLARLGMVDLEKVQRHDVPIETLKTARGRVVKFQTYRKEEYYRVDFATLSFDE